MVKMSKTKSEDQTTKTQVIKSFVSSSTKQEQEITHEHSLEQLKQNGGRLQNGDDDNEGGDGSANNDSSKKRNKLKKNKSKKGDLDKQNISVKSSFSKFDALQKRNLIHNPQGEMKTNCRFCDKPVYKMEEIKAEKSIYHKNCFRCHECNKHLKVDTYQSHEGVLYCTVHFKLLFAPKCVEDEDEIVQPRKPELIIRENQPTELPPDVVRASDKPDLGLEELQQLNVRSRFQVFEQSQVNEKEEQQLTKNNTVVRRSATILSKVAKLQQLGCDATNQQDSSASSDNEGEDGAYEEDIDSMADNPNAFFIRQKRREQKRERPIGIGEAMNDIRTLFEKGHANTKEERREERKQEIQNIRSRLFMGKQARIKEMYQQAVAECDHAADKKPEIDIEVDSKSLRERFEKGELFKDHKSTDENEGENSRKGAIEKEADVFESAISKKSRSIFMELDANVSGKHQNILTTRCNSKILQPQKPINSIVHQTKNESDNDVVKCGETVEDAKIQTSEISEKFKFFETYHPTEKKKRAFRITPPREGVVKMPSPDEENEEVNTKEVSPDRNIVAHLRTTSMMLNKFRELEKNPNRNVNNNSPKPLKCFTPPPDGNRRLYLQQDSEEEYDSNDEEDEEEDDEEYSEEDDYHTRSHLPKDDEALREAQNAARAKQLRIKFEKWQANEIKREKNDELNQPKIYANAELDDNSIESTQSIRERFERMRNAEKSSQPTRPRYQINRFV